VKGIEYINANCPGGGSGHSTVALVCVSCIDGIFGRVAGLKDKVIDLTGEMNTVLKRGLRSGVEGLLVKCEDCGVELRGRVNQVDESMVILVEQHSCFIPGQGGGDEGEGDSLTGGA